MRTKEGFKELGNDRRIFYYNILGKVIIIATVHETRFEFSCHGKCKAGSMKEGQRDVARIPDIPRQCSVTLCGASLVAGNAAADVFYSILTLSHALSTGLHRLACAILQAEPVFGRGESRVF